MNALPLTEYRNLKNNGYFGNNFAEVSILKYIDFYDSLHSNVYICPKCMKHGYHSIFHQSTLFEYCFIHRRIKLQKTAYPYALSAYYEQKLNSFDQYIDITVENIVKNNPLHKKLNEINDILCFEHNFTKYHFLSFKNNNDKLTTYNNLAKQFIKNKLFGENKICPIIEIFKIKKNDIFRESSKILQILSKETSEAKYYISYSDELLYTRSFKEFSGYMLEYFIKHYIDTTCIGFENYVRISNNIRDYAVRCVDVDIAARVIIFNVLISNYNNYGLKKYCFLERFDRFWQGRAVDPLFDINLSSYITPLTYRYYQTCSKDGIKYKSEILTFVLLKDIIEQTTTNYIKTISKANKHDNPKTLNITTIPQYIIEESADEFTIYRANY